MKFYQATNKKEYMPLLLLADEQESMIEKYIDSSVMFVIDDEGIKGEITVCELPENILEIKNLAVLPEFRYKGYGKKLIEFICYKYKFKCRRVIVGTGDSGLTIPFYEKCGFVKSHTVKNFFTDNYDHLIFENGKLLVDMIYLKRDL